MTHAIDVPGTEHEAAIGLGSNLGPSLSILLAAWRDLQEHPALTPVALSAPYRSQPLGMDSAPWFVNAAALVRTSLAPHALLLLLHTVEARYGRMRGHDTKEEGYRDRTLDLDLLLFDDLVIGDEHLLVPHPRMDQRLFVLAPLAEIAAGRIHPRKGKTIGTLLADCQHSKHGQLLDRIAWEPLPASFNPKG